MPATKTKKAAPKTTSKSNGSDVVALRKGGMGWAEIAKKIGVKTSGQAMFAYLLATEKLLKFASDKERDKAVVAMRDKEKLSWGIIAARTRLPESKLRSIYTATTGRSYLESRLGKGGRLAESNGTKAKSAAKKAVKASKKLAPVVEPTGFASKLAKMNDTELEKALTGRNIIVTKGGKDYPVKVNKVVKVNSSAKSGDRLVKFNDDRNRERIVKVGEITSAKPFGK